MSETGTYRNLISGDGHNRLTRGRHGYFLFNDNDVYVGRSLKQYGEFSRGEQILFDQVLKPGSVIAEIGANIGAHTVALARMVGRRGRVLAYEPQRIVFQTLCANVALNNLLNVECFQIALGDHKGQLKVPSIDYEKSGNFGGVTVDAHEQGQNVALERFDDHFRYRALHLMKIDVEGMELPVLEGARETIARHKPILYVENDRPDRSEDLIGLLFEIGYRLWWHTPPLFDPDNYYGNGDNVFGNIRSFNMLCVHRDTESKITGVTEITDPSAHPLNDQ